MYNLPQKISDTHDIVLNDSISTEVQSGHVLFQMFFFNGFEIRLERDPSTPFVHDPWEESEADLGLDLLWDTLETSRLLMADIPKFAAKAGSLNNSFMVVGEVLDIFRTEFLMKLLFGSKGCVSSSNERTNKFKQLIRIYSGRIALEK